jgi:hypothetical protein
VTRTRLASVAKGLLLTFALDRLGGSEDEAPVAVRQPVPRSAPASRRLLPLALGLLGVGLVLMLIFEAPVARVVGVVALLGFIVLGVFLIAEPSLLAEDEA